MPPAVFAREYENAFDSFEARFFDADAIAAAFGGTLGPTPPIPPAIPTPSFPRSGICGENLMSYSSTDPSTWSRFAASIMAIDVVGYSRLIGEDEAETARAVSEHREAARPIVASRG
jgi:hypothetical protein